MLTMNLEQLEQELRSWFPDEVESCPLNFRSFLDHIRSTYQPERSKRDDSCMHEWHEQVYRGDLESTMACVKCGHEMRCSELHRDMEISAEKTETLDLLIETSKDDIATYARDAKTGEVICGVYGCCMFANDRVEG